ncbi:hypothetical protein ElyMa_001609500 [Elysia marginata]|uniref:Uncharacterized protein n=1 Tax=Elysia marginata TaxID=1093978 RepID=A0AAV4JIA3_9GAST|nr:hypothetical protein ElyMa_001609500 [Elysia marginata]
MTATEINRNPLLVVYCLIYGDDDDDDDNGRGDDHDYDHGGDDDDDDGDDNVQVARGKGLHPREWAIVTSNMFHLMAGQSGDMLLMWS